MVSGILVTDSETVLRYISQGATFRQVKLNYLIALKADQELIEKFGDDYRRYMQKVPRINLVLASYGFWYDVEMEHEIGAMMRGIQFAWSQVAI